MLLNTSKNEKILKNQKYSLEAGFYWVDFFGQIFKAKPEWHPQENK